MPPRMRDESTRRQVCMLLMGDMRHESRMRFEAKSLHAAGYRVTLLGTDPNSSGDECYPEYTIRRFRVKRFSPAANAIGRVLRYQEFVWRAIRAAWRENAQVYHACDIHALLPAWIVSRVRGAKLVYEMRELWPWSPNHWLGLWRLLEGLLVHRADLVITVNGLRARFVEAEYRLKRAPLVLHNYPPYRESGPNDRLRKLVEQAGINPSRIVLYIGAILPERQLELLVEAVHLLNDGLVIVIQGFSPFPSYLEQLKSLVREKSLGGRVLFHEAVPPSEVHGYMASADVGIVTYRDDCINTRLCEPTKLYAYLMAGVPVVASDLPGMRSAFKGRPVGVLVKATAESIARGIEEVLHNEQQYSELRQNAVSVARSRFNWEWEEPKLVEAYRSLLS